MCECVKTSDQALCGPTRGQTNCSRSFRHDDVLGNMGLSGRNFVEKYENQATEMKRSLLEFMKAARVKITHNMNADTGSGADEDDLEVKMTTAGFPILPQIMHKTLSKIDYERIIRAYLSQHYCEFCCAIFHLGHPSPTCYRSCDIKKDQAGSI